MNTYEINARNEVIPYTSGRKCTDTRAWRDATELELQQQDQIKKLETELTAARAELCDFEDGIDKCMQETVKFKNERDMLAANNKRVIELLIDGLQTDGSHHKQWYLNEVLKLINADIAKDVKEHWTHDRGIAP